MPEEIPDLPRPEVSLAGHPQQVVGTRVNRALAQWLQARGLTTFGMRDSINAGAAEALAARGMKLPRGSRRPKPIKEGDDEG